MQVEAKERTDIDKLVARRQRLPVAPAGHCHACARSAWPMRPQLLEPWLGQSDALKALPVPRLIAIELDRDTPPDLDALARRIWRAVQGRHARRPPPLAAADPHHHALLRARRPRHPPARRRRHHRHHRLRDQERHGLQPRDRRGAALRRRHRPLHRPRVRAAFPAARRPGRASSGRVWAMFVFLAMPTVMELLGGGGVTIAEMRRLIGIGRARPAGLFPARHRRPGHRRAVHADVADRRLPHPEQPALIRAARENLFVARGWRGSQTRPNRLMYCCVTAMPTPGRPFGEDNVAGAGRVFAAAAGIALFAFLGGFVIFASSITRYAPAGRRAGRRHRRAHGRRAPAHRGGAACWPRAAASAC